MIILLSYVILLSILKKPILAEYTGNLFFILFIALIVKKLYDYFKSAQKPEIND